VCLQRVYDDVDNFTENINTVFVTLELV
jgi:hypothetical protein